MTEADAKIVNISKTSQERALAEPALNTLTISTKV